MPAANRTFWRRKLGRNSVRDQQSRAALHERGWRVVTIWECELKLQGRLEGLLKEVVGSA
jgi:DNA mismatch endonuclease (patch repair protein)